MNHDFILKIRQHDRFFWNATEPGQNEDLKFRSLKIKKNPHCTLRLKFRWPSKYGQAQSDFRCAMVHEVTLNYESQPYHTISMAIGKKQIPLIR